jgi:hypothetical protein
MILPTRPVCRSGSMVRIEPWGALRATSVNWALPDLIPT